MKAFVTGGAGFIGSHLVDKLAADGHEVTVYDNLSTGRIGNILKANPIIEDGDLGDQEMLNYAMEGCDIVFHLAANADVRHGLEDTERDLELNTLGTYSVLEAMRANNVKRIAFTSTGSVYGIQTTLKIPESAPFPIQTSLYGASKLAAEALIQAYCAGFGFQSYIFRLVGVIGERYSHGHVIDFYNQLIDHPDHLDILGNGNARKSYIYVGDVVKAIMLGVEKSFEAVNIFNVGSDWVISVRDAAPVIAECMGLNPKYNFGTGLQGWVGDNPLIHLDCSRIKQYTGWFPTLNYMGMVSRTIEYLKENHVATR